MNLMISKTLSYQNATDIKICFTFFHKSLKYGVRFTLGTHLSSDSPHFECSGGHTAVGMCGWQPSLDITGIVTATRN